MTPCELTIDVNGEERSIVAEDGKTAVLDTGTSLGTAAVQSHTIQFKKKRFLGIGAPQTETRRVLHSRFPEFGWKRSVNSLAGEKLPERSYSYITEQGQVTITARFIGGVEE